MEGVKPLPVTAQVIMVLAEGNDIPLKFRPSRHPDFHPGAISEPFHYII
jgi:hypothetical protein